MCHTLPKQLHYLGILEGASFLLYNIYKKIKFRHSISTSSVSNQHFTAQRDYMLTTKYQFGTHLMTDLVMVLLIFGFFRKLSKIVSFQQKHILAQFALTLDWAGPGSSPDSPLGPAFSSSASLEPDLGPTCPRHLQT
jgi:hypothetical protein